MKTKIKKIAFSASSAALLLPALAFGQFTPPDDTNLPSGSIFEIINNIMKWLLGLISFIAIIGFVIAGILYLTAAGDEKRIESAKKAMVYSIVGVVVALVGLVILLAAQKMLGGDDTQF